MYATGWRHRGEVVRITDEEVLVKLFTHQAPCEHWFVIDEVDLDDTES